MSRERNNVDLDYWIGIEECVCNSSRPIGGCMLCDLKNIKAYCEGLEQEVDRLNTALETAVSIGKDAIKKCESVLVEYDKLSEKIK